MKKMKLSIMLCLMMCLILSSVSGVFAGEITTRDNRHQIVHHDSTISKTSSYSFSQNQRVILLAGGSAATAIIAAATKDVKWAGHSAILGYCAATDQLEGLKYVETYKTERKFYEKDRLTGKERYLRTEWIGKTVWSAKVKNGSWKNIYSGDVTLTIK